MQVFRSRIPALNSNAPNAITFETNVGDLDLNGNSVTVSGLSSGHDPFSNPAVVNGGSSPATFTAASASDSTYGGFLDDGGPGALSFVKKGAGTLTFNGTWSYTGTTFIDAGTLRLELASRLDFSSSVAPVTVASGASLELAGTISDLSSNVLRVNVMNNSDTPGLLVSGTNQQVGNIDGLGTTQVNAGSDLTANHIIQTLL